jgi:CHAT domain-containing protein/tetratricopeptide (TPR) repeat protein
MKEQHMDFIKRLLQEIVQLNQITDMPRRVGLCRQALNLVARNQNPQLWAALQVELGNSLFQNPKGNRSDNLEQAIKAYQDALTVKTQEAMPVDWAMTMNNLGIAYRDRIRGEKADNLEQAIKAYQDALTVRTQEAMPVDWAMTMNNLGLAYRDRIRGEKADNLEQAIKAYQDALTVYTQATIPVQWAATMNNLGITYRDRIKGEKADNLEQAIKAYQDALTVYTQATIPVQWAATMNNLGNAYLYRIRGERADNLEQAIKAYQDALTVYTQATIPVQWAATMNNLGNAYLYRIRGERANNLEQAIKAYQDALTVRTQEAMPIDWATTMNNLGLTYRDRIRGERADNMEQAIKAYQDALTVYTQEAIPVDWAMTMNNLGSAYRDRIRGVRADNLEQAIKAYLDALTVYTQEAIPGDWAATMNNLGLAYRDRIRGMRADNLEQAIKAYLDALTVYTQEAIPVDWAATMNNLGLAYRDRIRGERADNLEQAIKAYQDALTVRTQEGMPIDWAMTINNLGCAYRDRIRGERADNLEQAIKAYRSALTVRTQEAMPVDWAMTINNLGCAYRDRIRGERADNLEQAIKAYRSALTVITQEAMPVDWAMIMNNLGNAYRDRIRGERADNLEQGIKACQDALTVITQEAMPVEHRLTQHSLGNLFFYKENWGKARVAYNDAIATGRLLLTAAYTEAGRKSEVVENAAIYRNAAFATARLGDTPEALLTLEQGKTRQLVEDLRLRVPRPPNIPDAVWTAFEQAGAAVRAIQSSPLESPSHERNPVEIYKAREQAGREAVAALDNAVGKVRSYVPDFLTEIDLSAILSMPPDRRTAIISFCVTVKGSLGFLVTQPESQNSSKSTGFQMIDVPGFTEADLNRLLFTLDDQENILGGWLGDYLSYVTQRSGDTFQRWQTTMEQVMAEVGEKLLMPILTMSPSEITHLILLPAGGLFLLPLHAAPLPGNSAVRMCDRYKVSYAPSAEVLANIRKKSTSSFTNDLYAVINPEEDSNLVFTPVEGSAIAGLFGQRSSVHFGWMGTKKAVVAASHGRTYLHFSCHGSYNWDDPPASGLVLADGLLSLEELQKDVIDISASRLVTLSACETGITDVRVAEEYVGLPAGFMLAGARCVVSSLWAVPDLSTAIMMERFYSHHLKDEMTFADALHQAQLEVRTMSAAEVAAYAETAYQQADAKNKSKMLIYRNHYRYKAEQMPGSSPFSHPYYWAAFTVNGM